MSVAVTDAAYPQGFVPNRSYSRTARRGIGRRRRISARKAERAHGRAQGQRPAERAALASRTARRHARRQQARGQLTDVDKLFGISIIRHHGKRLRESDPRGAAYRHRQQVALATATATGGPVAAAEAF
jgi:hypothetical protein